jgi:hypothetical protein
MEPFPADRVNHFRASGKFPASCDAIPLLKASSAETWGSCGLGLGFGFGWGFGAGFSVGTA